MSAHAEPEDAGDERLDRLFHALADPTRRRILATLVRGPARVTDLARPFRMSLPAVSKHLRVLEEAGLISRVVEGRVHRLTLRLDHLGEIDAWLAPFRARSLSGAGGTDPPASDRDPELS